MSRIMIPMHVCGCCDDSAYQVHASLCVLDNQCLRHTMRRELHRLGVRPDVIAGMVEVFSVDLSNMPPASPGRSLVNACLHFLYWSRHKKFPRRVVRNPFHVDKYITLWSFVYSFLGIPKNSGYDYLLMCYLERYDLMEHGGGIRCAYAHRKKACVTYEDPTLAPRFAAWATDAPDEV